MSVLMQGFFSGRENTTTQMPPLGLSARYISRSPCSGSGKSINPRRHAAASKLAELTGRFSPSAVFVNTFSCPVRCAFSRAKASIAGDRSVGQHQAFGSDPRGDVEG